MDKNASIVGAALGVGVAVTIGGLMRFSLEGMGSIGHGVVVFSLSVGDPADAPIFCSDRGEVESAEYVYCRLGGDLKRTLRAEDEERRLFLAEDVWLGRIAD